MAYHLFLERLLRGEPLPITGDGTQVRGNTFVTDCVDATVRAALGAPAGEVYNVGGGERTTLLDVVRMLERIVGREARLDFRPPRPGDQISTGADATKLARHLGWRPATPLNEGLAAQAAWQASMLAAASRAASTRGSARATTRTCSARSARDWRT